MPHPESRFVYNHGTKLMAGAREFKPVGVNLGNWFVLELYLMRFDEKKVNEAGMYARLRKAAGSEARYRKWRQTWRDNFFTEDDIARIAADGYNTVRVPLMMDDFTDRAGRTVFCGAYGETLPRNAPDGLKYLDRLIGWCRTHRVYVMPDMHRYGPGDSSIYVASPYEVNAKLERIKAAWETIARRYADVEIIIGYDLLNEPPGYTDHLLRPTYAQLIEHVRRFDRNHLVIVESNIYSDLGKPGAWTLGERLDETMAVSVHYYPPWKEMPPATLDADAPEGRKYLAWRYCHDMQLPLIIGEIGENSLPVTQGLVRLFRNGKDGLTAGTLYWTYKKLGDQWGCAVNVPEVKEWPVIQRYVNEGGRVPPQARRILMEMALATNAANARHGMSDGWGDLKRAMFE